jgi:acyl-CoA synthetase (AMP-forming)/AMP-acid ligase II
MRSYAPPSILFQGREWSSSELAAMAVAWRETLGDILGASPRPTALVLANHPEAVALFFALSCFPRPLIVLPPELRGWRSSPALPGDTHLVLAPAFAALRGEAERLGLEVTVLAAPDLSARAGDARFLSLPGVVLFTSGSTELPKPVYRSIAHMTSVTRAYADALQFPSDRGVIGALPLARGFGFTHCLMPPTVFGVPLGLFERFDHTAVLAAFASDAYYYWPFTPVMADVLGRCVLPGPCPAPVFCATAGRLSGPVCESFRARFGVPLRQLYGTTETGIVTVDAAPAAEVRSDTAGAPLPGVEIRIGDDPSAALPPGQLGRIWLRSPLYMMDGYGFPPDLQPAKTVDGWWATPDAGHLDERGGLTIAGRLDDCVRTGSGYLVNASDVAAALEAFPGVTDAAVVPLDTPAGPVIGALVESAQKVSPADLRSHLSRQLPPWAQPRLVEVTSALPRLSSGRTDRRACIAILEGSSAREATR